MSNSNLDFIESADIYQQQSQSNPDQNNWDGDPEIAEEEEFLIHLKFDHGSYPLRHDVNNIDFLGVKDGNLFIRIGDSYFMGEYDKRNNSSILFGYDKHNQSGLYQFMQTFIDSSQSLMGLPEKFNKALFGGILGSWFSLLQFVTMPLIGSLSDVYGRRIMYLSCLVSISLSYLLWVVSANYFSIFVLFRTFGGLSKGNISLSTAIITDVSTEEKRGKGFALIGIAFSLAFILQSIGTGLKDAFNYINPSSLLSFRLIKNTHYKEKRLLQLGGWINFTFLFIYSGLEFTLTFLTYIRFNFTNIQQGKLFFYVGIVMFLIQGLFVRRINVKNYPTILLTGIAFAIPAFFIIGLSSNLSTLSFGLVLYAYSSATVVPTLSTLVSTFGSNDQKGTVLGTFRSIGALARATGPLTASFIFWKYGIQTVYCLGGCAMFIPLYLAVKLNSSCKIHKDPID
ncbi:Major facilitator super domain-containing protein 10 [Blomia tropicalis]|nr:Major facilitator super domain-containing protein 10 [Blomia tropicalis]